MRQPFLIITQQSLSDDRNAFGDIAVVSENAHHIDTSFDIAQIDVDRFALAFHLIHHLTHQVINRNVVQTLTFHCEETGSRIREDSNAVRLHFINAIHRIRGVEIELVMVINPVGR